MRISIIDPSDNLVLVTIGSKKHYLPCAIDFDSDWATHHRGEPVSCTRDRPFSDREFYKLGKQLLSSSARLSI